MHLALGREDLAVGDEPPRAHGRVDLGELDVRLSINGGDAIFVVVCWWWCVVVVGEGGGDGGDVYVCVDGWMTHVNPHTYVCMDPQSLIHLQGST